MAGVLERLVPRAVLDGVKNSLYLYVGTVVNQVIAFIGLLFIARMLGPEDYGVYATVGAFVGLFNFLVLGGLNKYIVREGSRDPQGMGAVLDRTIGVRNVFALVGVLSCVGCAMVFPYPWETRLYIVLFSSSLAYGAFNNFLQNIYLAFERMQFIAYINVFQSTVFVAVSVACLYLGLGLTALYLVAIASYVLSLVVNHRISRGFVRFDPLSRVVMNRDVLRSALVFSLISLTVYLYTTVDVLMISLFGDPVEVARYSVPFVIFSQGTVLLNMVSTAFFPVFVKGLERPMDRRRFLRYSLGIALLGVAIAVPAYLLAEEVLVLLFGSEYAGSVVILQLLVLLWPIRFWGMPFSSALQATGKETQLLLMIVPRALMNVVLNYLFYFEWGLIGIVYATLLVIGVAIPLTNALAYRILRRQGVLE